MATIRHPETPVELSVSLFDSFGKFVCSKGSSSISYRVDWCINRRLLSNQFIGRPVKEEEKKRWRKSRFDQFSCITVAVYFSYFGSGESLDQIPKKAFPMYGGIGVSAPSLRRESTLL